MEDKLAQPLHGAANSPKKAQRKPESIQ